MAWRRDIRHVALQTLYQLDARGEEDMADIDLAEREAPCNAEDRTEGMDMARGAWAIHEKADEIAQGLAPAWPTSRQTPIDRSIIRLAYYEMHIGSAPVAVVINEAIELAKTFGTERSAAFVNGVLDKMKNLVSGPLQQDSETKNETEDQKPEA